MYSFCSGSAARSGAVRARNHSRGVILVVVMIVMLVLTVLMSGLWTLRTQDGVEAGRNVASVAAFWAAEAGMHAALLRLNTDSGYQSSPTNFSGSITNGLYAVAVSATSPSNYLIVSTGTVGSSYRIVQQTTTVSQQWDAGFDYALSSYSPKNSTLYNNVKVNGNVYDAGPLTVQGGANVNGIIYDNSVSGSGTYTNQPPPSPAPTMPALDMSYYNTQLSYAALASAGNKTYTTLNLAGGTTLVHGSVTINNYGAINGPGVLVATGGITIQNNSTVGSNIILIAGGKLDLETLVQVQHGDTLYSSTEVDLHNSGIVVNDSAIVTPGNVTVFNNCYFSGIIYVGGNYTLQTLSTNVGSVVVGGQVNIQNTALISYDPSQFPSSIIGLNGGPAVISKLAWSEK